jgi:uncharacterized delta-60 repeat protein
MKYPAKTLILFLGIALTGLSLTRDLHARGQNPSSATPAGPNSGAVDPLTSMVVQKDGKILIGGKFISYNGTARNHIARLNVDGTLDASFDPGSGANKAVTCIVVQADGKILIGGDFTVYNGIPLKHVARLNTDGMLDTSFDPRSAASSGIHALAVQPDGKILIGGYFLTPAGKRRNCIARLNANGTPDASFNLRPGDKDSAFSPGWGANDFVFSIAVQPDGKILIVGVFLYYNGKSRNYVARLNADGTLDTSFNPGSGANWGVTCVALQPDGKILIGGEFTSYNGKARKCIARLNANGSLDPSFDPGPGPDDLIISMAPQPDGKVVIGGWFTQYGRKARNYIARINANGTLDASFDPGSGASDSIASTVVQPDGKVLVGGEFISYNGAAVGSIARLTADGSLDTSFATTPTAGGAATPAPSPAEAASRGGTLDGSFDPGSGTNDVIFSAIAQTDGKILIGGWFRSYNGVSRRGICRLNADGTVDRFFDPGSGVNNLVASIAVQADGRILIGGNYSGYNGIRRDCIARLDTKGALDPSFNPGSGANEVIRAVAMQPDGKILIGGDFSSYNLAKRNCITRLNADGTLDTSFGPGSGADNRVHSIAVQPDGRIIIGGDFSSYNGTARNRIARLNADGTLDMSFDPGSGADESVTCVALQGDGKIVVGGVFTTYNGRERNHIARLNADGTLDTSFEPGTGASEGVFAMAFQGDGRILIGGDFTSYNGTSRHRFARLNADGSLDISFNPGSGVNGSVSSIAVQTDGKVLIGGNYSRYNGTVRRKIARVNG